MIIEPIGTNRFPKEGFSEGVGTLVLGPWVWISDGVYIETHTHDFNDDWTKEEFPHTLTIEPQVYIGPRAMILHKCTHIAEGVLIGAGAVVTKDIDEPWSIWAGNPAKLIGYRWREIKVEW